MSTTVTYKGSTLTTINNQTRTLKTAGKYMEGDVILTDVTSSSSPTLQSKTYNVSSAGTATVTADSGYDGLSSVAVSVPQGDTYASAETRFFTSNSNRYWEWRAFATVDESEEAGEKGFIGDGYFEYGDSNAYNAIPSNTTVTPTESSQTIGGANYMMEGAVTVNAIPSNYVGSGITRRTASDLTASGATVTVPAGYYSAAAQKSVANGSATAPASISGTAASVSTGTNTLTLTKTVSVTPTVSAGYVSSGTAGNSSVSLTASVTTKAAATITPTTTNQTIAAGTYLTGAQTIAGDADLIGSNILSTANIFGVQGTVDFVDVYIRSAAPTSAVGNDGDIYIQE